MFLGEYNEDVCERVHSSQVFPCQIKIIPPMMLLVCLKSKGDFLVSGIIMGVVQI